MSKKVYVVGVGMMAKVAINRALKDSGCDYNLVQAAIAGYVYGDSTCGQR